jgi:hypothetical protein
VFSKKVNDDVESLNRFISLLRDLVIGVTIVLTCVIVYFGGDPSHLNVLDWTKLIGAAFLIVLVPLLIFFLVRVVLRFLQWVGGFMDSYSNKLIKGLLVYPRLHKVVLKLKEIDSKCAAVMTVAYPYYYAAMSLILAVFVFYKVLRRYIPQ